MAARALPARIENEPACYLAWGEYGRLLEPYVPQGGFQREDDLLRFRFPVPALGDPLMAQLARNAAAVTHMFKRMAEGGLVLPLALAEKRLQSIGPKALLETLQRHDRKPPAGKRAKNPR